MSPLPMSRLIGNAGEAEREHLGELGERRVGALAAAAASATTPTLWPRAAWPRARSQTCRNSPPTGARSTCRMLRAVGHPFTLY